MSDDDETMAAVRSWASKVSAALGIDPAELDLDAVLGVAGLAARTAVRPAAPVTTYLVGYAVGRASATAQNSSLALTDALASVRAVAASHRADDGTPTDPHESSA